MFTSIRGERAPCSSISVSPLSHFNGSCNYFSGEIKYPAILPIAIPFLVCSCSNHAEWVFASHFLLIHVPLLQHIISKERSIDRLWMLCGARLHNIPPFANALSSHICYCCKRALSSNWFPIRSICLFRSPPPMLLFHLGCFLASLLTATGGRRRYSC
jgi:hypothetical protein